MSEAALELKNFSAEVPGRGLCIVNGQLKAGEKLVLRGPSGCGKTTLLRSIAGLHPTTGLVQVGGIDVSKQNPGQRKIGFMFQEAALFPFLNVVDNVAFGLRYQLATRDLSEDLRRSRALELLKRFNLEALAQRSVVGLSGGEAQRISLLRVLLTEPKVLLLDEPLASIDAGSRKPLAAWIIELVASKGLATIIVAHHNDELSSSADKVVEWKDESPCQIVF